MKRLTSFYFPLIIWCLISCGANQINKKDESLGDSIVGVNIGDSLIFSRNCTYITTIGENLLLSNMQPVDGYAYRLLDLNDKNRVGSFGLFGAGPGEFLCQEFAGMSADSDTLYAYDISFKLIQVYTKRKDSYLYDYSRTLKVLTDDNCFFQKVRRLQNGLYVGIPLSGEKLFYVLLNQDGKEIGRFGKLPVLGDADGTIDFQNLEGPLITVGNRIYFGTQHFGYLACYDVQETGEASLVWEQNLSEPSYEIDESQIRLNREKNIEGFSGIAVVNDFILATYTGIAAPLKLGSQEHLPKNLLVFNKDGELLRKLHLDVYGTYLTVTDDKKTLIMKCYDPEITYRAYDLDEILANL